MSRRPQGVVGGGRAIPADGSVRRIAIVGGGASGVVTARVLTSAGYDVVLFEKAADLGGVWSASRAYPGISTQDDRRSYAFSDRPMPDGVAEHPAGADVRRYLEQYLRAGAASAEVRLGTAVTRARLIDDREWEVESDGPGGSAVDRFDLLVAANGMFSSPHVPVWPGRDAFETAGGRVVVPGSLGDGGVLDASRTVVVGWGKTACDVAVVAAERGASTDVVARTLTWKYPKRIGLLGLTFRHIVLTRAGERLIGTPYRDGAGRVLLRRLPERVPRVLLGRLLGRAADRVAGFSAVGLRPGLEFRASTGLVTEGFLEAVADGRIRVHRERSVEALGADDDGPWVLLTDGVRIPADTVVAATGFEQGAGFLTEEALARGVDATGAFLLHRRVLAVDVPRLAFAGWAHNYRSPITAEIGAVWLAAVLGGRVRLPSVEAQRRTAARFPLRPTPHSHARAAGLPSVSLRELDTVIREAGGALPRRIRIRQLWRPLDPADYAETLRAVLAEATAAVR